MKKIILLIVTISLILATASCVQQQNNNSSVSTSTSISYEDSIIESISRSDSDTSEEVSSASGFASISSFFSNITSSSSQSKTASSQNKTASSQNMTSSSSQSKASAFQSSKAASSSIVSENPETDSSTDIILEAEDYYERSTGITTEKNGNYTNVNEMNYAGEVNDSIDEFLRFQPVDFKEGYKTVNICYAHETTSVVLSVDIYMTDGDLIANIVLPSTGNLTSFSKRTVNLPVALTGEKDLLFIFRDAGDQLCTVNVDWISFTRPFAHVINKNEIDYSMFKTGKPDLSGYQASSSINITDTGEDIIIENKKFYPAFNAYAITITGNKTGKIIIRNCFFGGINGAAVNGLNPKNGKGILIMNSSNVLIENNYFDCIQLYGVWVEANGSTQSNNININNNRFFCMQGDLIPGAYWGYTAKCVQFLNIQGFENKIWNNRCFNYPGISYMTDFINVYASSGTSESPIKIYYNEFLGGAQQGLYNAQGCGIQIGDHISSVDGGQYTYGKYNKLVFPGAAGMNINGGYKQKMSFNKIYSSGKLKFINGKLEISDTVTWAGMSLFNWSGGISRDKNHVLEGNKVSFSGSYYGGFLNYSKPLNTIIKDNDFSATLYPLELLSYNFMD